MTNNQFYLHSSPEGVIKLIEGDKMPVKPEDWADDEGYLASMTSPLYARKMKAYREALKLAKGQAVTVADQEKALELINGILGNQFFSCCIGPKHTLHETCSLRGRVHGPFSLRYEIREACQHDSCPVDAMCEHCKEPVKVAILYDDTPEREPQEYNIEALRKELAEYTKAYNQECERNDAIKKDLEYWAQRSADLLKELEELRKQ